MTFYSNNLTMHLRLLRYILIIKLSKKNSKYDREYICIKLSGITDSCDFF